MTEITMPPLPHLTRHYTSWDGDSCCWLPIYAYTADQLRARDRVVAQAVRAACINAALAEIGEGGENLLTRVADAIDALKIERDDYADR